MAYATISQVFATFKEVYGRRISELPNRKAWIYNQFKRMNREHGGKYVTFPVQLEGGQSVGSVGDNEPLPGGGATKDAQAETTVETRIDTKFHYAIVKITGPTIAQSRSQLYAFVQAKNYELKKKTEWLVSFLNGECFRHGINMAEVKSDTANKIVVTDGDQIRHFRKGVRIDIWASNWSAKRNGTIGTKGEGREVTAVDKTLKEITYGGSDLAATVVAGDRIVREDTVLATSGPNPAAGVEITGLEAIVDDNTDGPTIFQNISRATNAEWKAQVLRNAGTDRELTNDLLQRAEDAGDIEAGNVSDMLITGYGQRRKMIALLLPDVRYAPQTLKGGYRVLQWNDKAWYVDKDCQPRRVYLLCKEYIQRYVSKEIGILDTAGPAAERIAGFDVYELVIAGYLNLGCEMPNCQVRVDDLAEPAGA